MNISRYILFAAATIGLGACSNDLSDSDWAPGTESTAPGVYFAPNNETFLTLLDGDNLNVELSVKRLDTEGELTVPVIVNESDPAMIVPSSITFADGSNETKLVVDCSSSPAIEMLTLSLTFPEEYVNPYAAGAAEYKGSVILSKWENVSDTGLTEFTVVNWNFKDEGYNSYQSEMQHLLGSNRYRIKHFLNTSVDFTFELQPSPLKEDYYRIVPVSNQLLLADFGWGDYAYYNSWWLIADDFESEDEDAEGWPDVVLSTPDGLETIVYYIQFLWYDDATKTEYCYVLNYDSGKPVAYMSFYGNLDEDMETYMPYSRIRFSWTE